MTELSPDWAVGPNPEVRGEMPRSEIERPLTNAQLQEVGAAWLTGFLKEVVRALTGGFVPGESPAGQLGEWAEGITDVVGGLAAAPLAAAEMILNLLGSFLGIPNLGVVLQKLALLPSILLDAAGEGEGDVTDDNILDRLLDALRNIFNPGQGQDPTDTTPPTAPNLALSGATSSTLTVTASGGVDP